VFGLGILLVVESEEVVVLEAGYIAPDYLSSDRSDNFDFECSFAQAEHCLSELDFVKNLKIESLRIALLYNLWQTAEILDHFRIVVLLVASVQHSFFSRHQPFSCILLES
jgi:hypothetical protein